MIMKTILITLFLGIGLNAYAQNDTRISTLDFVQIIDGQRAETIYYYTNNWKALRDEAMKKGYIHSFELLEVPRNENEPFDIILITTYSNPDQYAKREDNFGELIEARGGRRLMNEKQPSEFRKIIFNREDVRHIF